MVYTHFQTNLNTYVELTCCIRRFYMWPSEKHSLLHWDSCCIVSLCINPLWREPVRFYPFNWHSFIIIYHSLVLSAPVSSVMLVVMDLLDLLCLPSFTNCFPGFFSPISSHDAGVRVWGSSERDRDHHHHPAEARPVTWRTYQVTSHLALVRLFRLLSCYLLPLFSCTLCSHIPPAPLSFSPMLPYIDQPWKLCVHSVNSHPCLECYYQVNIIDEDPVRLSSYSRDSESSISQDVSVFIVNLHPPPSSPLLSLDTHTIYSFYFSHFFFQPACFLIKTLNMWSDRLICAGENRTLWVPLGKLSLD